MLWDSLIYLKLKCPTLDVQDHIARVEMFLPREDIGKLDDRGAAEVNI
jgi:hypothetical protein